MEYPQKAGENIMSDNQKIKLPISVADILVSDILQASDEEIVSEAHKVFDDVDSVISEARNIIDASVMKSRKSKLTAARAQLEKSKGTKQETNVLLFSISDKRKLISQAKNSVDSLTLAARNEEKVSEADADGILQDLIKLGVIDEDGNLK